MKISIDEVNYIAKLSKLKLTVDEASLLAKQFEDILVQFQNLNNEDFEDIKCDNMDLSFIHLRKDEALDCNIEKSDLFRNVKNMRNGFIEIPKVLE